MSEQVNGLLTQKPDSPAPAAGNTQRFSWEQRTGKSGKPWIKIKNEGEGYGSECEVVSAEKTDFTDSHGNVSYNVSFIPTQDGAGGVGGEAQSAPPATSDRSAEINRAVAFKGAVEIAASRIQSGTLKPEDATEAIHALTAALLPVVQGNAEGNGDGASQPATADDIPF